MMSREIASGVLFALLAFAFAAAVDGLVSRGQSVRYSPR